MEPQTKTCGQCGTELPITDFYYRWSRKRKDGSLDTNYYSPCKHCRNKQRRERRHNQPDVRLHEIVRDLHGITGEQYKNMLASQNGVCAICKKTETRTWKGSPTRLTVDHNHENGRIRSLLCSNCNALLGLAHDDISILESAIAYLKSHS